MSHSGFGASRKMYPITCADCGKEAEVCHSSLQKGVLSIVEIAIRNIGAINIRVN